MLAAEMLDVPYATVLVITAGNLLRPNVVADTLDRVRNEFGVPSDPYLAARSRYLVLSPFPPRLRDPAFPLPATAHIFRSVEVSRASIGPASLPQYLTGAPSVYVTLGTEFNVESGDLFTRVLAGLGPRAKRLDRSRLRSSEDGLGRRLAILDSAGCTRSHHSSSSRCVASPEFFFTSARMMPMAIPNSTVAKNAQRTRLLAVLALTARATNTPPADDEAATHPADSRR